MVSINKVQDRDIIYFLIFFKKFCLKSSPKFTYIRQEIVNQTKNICHNYTPTSLAVI